MGTSKIKVLKLVNGSYIAIPFADFCQLTLREALCGQGEYLLRIGLGLFATGDETLLAALQKEPESAFPLHEVLRCMLPCWTRDLLDQRIVDLPFHPRLDAGADALASVVARVKAAFPGAEVVA